MSNISKREGYLLTTIPFSGFYETMWNEYFCYDMEHEFAAEAYPDKSDSELNDVVNAVYDTIDHQATREAIASEYVNQFNHYYDTSLEFESLQSPREYNFTTDTIFCHISLAELEKLYSELDLKILDEVVKGKFTSCSGFISFYSNNIDDWQLDDLASLDHNEIGTLIEAWLYTKHFELDSNEHIGLTLENDLLDACLIGEKVVYE